ncbi:MAG: hypothetical protein SFU86_08450 [Pirellulaceae bacterium]|nr:hypothetical protein [Pirellulaceae bacterium]
MPEVWLRTNRRALALGLVVPAVLCALGLAAAAYGIAREQSAWAIGFYGILGAGSGFLVAMFIYWMRLPRLAYARGELLVYLDSAQPVRVPIDVVECFFLGQGDSNLPKLAGREPETQNVIVRLAEAATEWKHRDVKPAFGHWCEGYITIRGAWCEPITPDLMRHLNARLGAILRERKAARQEAAS